MEWENVWYENFDYLLLNVLGTLKKSGADWKGISKDLGACEFTNNLFD